MKKRSVCRSPGGGVTMAPPDVDKSVYPISNKGADYGNHINNTCPSGLPDLPTALHNKSGAVKEAICYIV